MPPNLLKDAMLLADRARSQHVREGTASTAPRRMLSRPATSAAVVCHCHSDGAARLSQYAHSLATCAVSLFAITLFVCNTGSHRQAHPTTVGTCTVQHSLHLI